MTQSARFSVRPSLVRRIALASIIANVGIVVTGGAVRLTASGLGCPTWPRCTDESYVSTAEMGIHGAIEFGNRLLTFAVGAVALAALVAVLLHRPRRRSLVLLALAVLAGIAVQAIIGGITVHTDLHPMIVGIHFVGSMALLLLTYALWRRIGESDGPKVRTVPAPLHALVWITTAVSAAVIMVGTLVTGSGPHAGDADAERNGLDPATISQLHADLVFLLIGLSVALWLALKAVGAPPRAVRAAVVLLVVELAQGVVGFVQYLTDLPVLLVGLHMLGSCLVWLATLAVLWSTRERPPVGAATTPPADPGDPAERADRELAPAR
ncbi:COX15/CtaA family protein [Polymorphospora rubra]|uniref:Cytochrome b561 n=1 Tax=Polymorphospora rubra TaxID=338584 RepID=A0A810MV68_9ACTN|nr:COX15/CtaA family protein [Polymorphospora rubra]BCJ63208.1 cytochrome b561 [Polymorphospora rubra]